MADPVALYVDKERGPYPALGVECYGADDDARRYYGPGPVVAHPPCGPWGSFRGLCWKQDPALAPTAVQQVRRVGGVLEHPAGSRLWEFMGLPAPSPSPPFPLGLREFALEVQQVDWGHRARKRTWLLVVGLAGDQLPPFPRRRAPTHVVSSSNRPGARGFSLLPKLWSDQTHLTPPAFAEWLLRIAARCRPLDPVGVTATGSEKRLGLQGVEE